MKSFFLFFSLIFLGGCAMMQPAAPYKKALAQATAQRWSGGAPGSGRGVIFTIKFYQLQEALDADTLLVNNVPTLVSMSQVGDTTYLISSFDTQQSETKTLANAPSYSGSLLLQKSDKKIALPIASFTILPSLNYP